MTTPVVSGMGQGLGVHGEGDQRRIDHAGATVGYRTYMVGFPASGDGIVIMTSGDGGAPLIQEVCRAFAEKYGWPGFEPRQVAPVRLSARALDGLAGRYRVREYGFVLTLQRRGNALVADTPRGSRYVFHPVAPLRFIAREDGAELEFDPDHPGRLEVWGMHATRLSGKP